ncbi:UPF0481 protein At3g47200 [Citrus clementina]|nr:UPF0481 protein At3g47200 [Citrus x clementina]
MESKDHASVDVEKLAESLSGNFKTMRCPSSESICIYRVHQSMRCDHSSDYTPMIISIGPLHHGNPELQAMEEHKLRYLRHFLQRTEVSMTRFLAFIKEKEAKLRNCYAETIHLGSDEFVTMILLDSVFIIEFFMRSYGPTLIIDDDPLFTESGLGFLGLQMQADLYLEENQLPLFILSELLDLAKTATYNGDIYEGISLMTVVHSWFSAHIPLKIVTEDLIGVQFSKAKHFLDLIILCLHSLQPPPSVAQSEFNYQNMPGAKELHRVGVEFKPRSYKNLLDIKFYKRTLEIPFFRLFDRTERFYRNLLIFENMHVYPVKYFNDYVIIMSYFLVTPRDADLLIQNGIIGLGDSEKLSTVFRSLIKDCLKSPDFLYADLVKVIQAYCKLPTHRWKANLKQNYFNTPWASISVIAAVILLLLTVTQTICSIIAL